MKADAAEIRRALEVLVEPGSVVELRALGVPNGKWANTWSGYFDDLDAMVDAAARLSDAGAKGVYLTLNPGLPALLARAPNRARATAKDDPTTGDRDIERRRWLLVDCDPERPSGISASNDEKKAALEVAREVAKALRAAGWPGPVGANSGNGWHLLYRIDLPADDAGLVQRALEGIAFRFSDERVKVDVSVHNPARICKLYGTAARKGESTDDRPHRLSRMTNIPASVEVVSEEKLRAVAAWRPRSEPKQSTRGAGGDFSIDDWISKHGLKLRGPHPWQGGRKWIFSICPWNAEHRNGAAYIVEHASGALSAGCHHDGCQGKGWPELRLLHEPDAYSKREERKSAGDPAGDAKRPEGAATERTELAFERLGDLLAEPDGAIEWVVKDLLAQGGFGALVAKPKVGKSTLARCLALAVARGEDCLGRATTQGPVLYLALEESRRQVKKHFRKLGATADDPIHIFVGRSPAEALIKLRLAIAEYEPVLVVIDTLFRFARVKDANDYAIVTAALEPLLATARESGACVLVLHHSPKGDPRAAIDAALGSTAIAGTVDTMLVMRRTGTVRLISSEQREGEGFSEEVTLGFDAGSGLVTLGPTKKAADEADAGGAILEWLKAQSEPVEESAIHEAVDGRKAIKLRALRNLVDGGQVTRTGEGKRGKPYLYAIAAKPTDAPPESTERDSGLLVPTISREPEYQNSKSAKNVAGAEGNSGSRVFDFSRNQREPEKNSGNQHSGASSAELMARFTDNRGEVWEWLLDNHRDLANAIDQAGTDEVALAAALRAALEAWEASLLL